MIPVVLRKIEVRTASSRGYVAFRSEGVYASRSRWPQSSDVQFLTLSVVMVGCSWTNKTDNTAAVKRLIQAQTDESVEAARIAPYMSVLPDDSVVH
jgi:hypothetical protein